MPLTQQISANIYRFTNQYFYAELVGVYLVELPTKVLLVDLPSYTKEVEDYLLSFRKPLVTLLSHGSCGIADGTKWQAKIGLKVYLHRQDKENSWLAMKPDIFYDKPPQIAEAIEVIHTPGHTSGSICVLEKTTRTLFSGDTFGGTPDGEIWDFMKKDGYGDLALRLESCKKLLRFKFKNALPFHYEMILGKAKESLARFLKKHESGS